MGRYSSLGWTIVIGVAAVLLAPVVVLAGEPALRLQRRGWRHTQNGYIGRQVRGRGMGPMLAAQFQLHFLMMRVARNAVVIALTAPARWVESRIGAWSRRRMLRGHARFMRMGGGEGLFPDDPPFLSGVREPRRPSPVPPSDAVALEPPNEHTGIN